MKNLISLSDDFELISQILSHVPGYIVFQDSAGKFLCANDLAITDLGFDNLEQMTGLYPYEIRCPAAQIHDEVMASIQYVIEQGCPVTTLFSVYLANHQWGLYLGQQQPLRNHIGSIIGVATHTLAVTSTPLTQHLSYLFTEVKPKGQIKLRQGIHKYLDSAKEWNLSIRQGECLFWILQRKSAKEIGLILGLSKRTVEHYINLIKAKFNVNTLNELVELARERNLLNYIPQHWCHFK